MLRKARMQDVEGILDVMLPYVEKDIILRKTREEVIARIRDYVIWEEDGVICGCAAFYPGWDGLGEIRSTAVAAELHGRGIGRKLVEACLADARSLGVRKVFVLTYETAFFARLGFVEVDKHSLPQKIFTDCIKCRHFPDCNETAMVQEIGT